MTPEESGLRKAIRNPALGILLILLLLAVLTRTIDLGARVMSHDEINHVYFAWLWFNGGTYQHNPVSHGPLQFHLLNLSYSLLGDSDVSARLPAALSGVAAIALIWPFRRWLRARGALAAATLLLFSPYMLFYSRYTRNEIFVVIESLLTLWAILRYLETRQNRWLYLLAATMAFHATTKETFYIQTAQWMIFLAVCLILQWFRSPWPSNQLKTGFGIAVLLSGFGLGLALVEFLRERTAAGEAAIPMTSSLVYIGAVIGGIGLVILAVVLVRAFGQRLRYEFPLFDVLLLMTTLTLPLLGALPAQAFGWDPMAYSDSSSITRTTLVVIILLAIALLLGLFWDRRRWLIAAGIFVIIYVPLYTSFFTNPFGLFSGIVGSLGYWLVQQGVERGSQPWFYYSLLQIPMYEFLPALGAAFGTLLALLQICEPTQDQEHSSPSMATQRLLVAFLIFSSITTLLIYTYAGERMPWITVHLVLPLIMLSGWWFGEVFTLEALRTFFSARGLAIAGLGLVVFLSIGGGFRFILGMQPSISTVFQGVEQITGWALPTAVAFICFLFLLKLAEGYPSHQLLSLSALTILSLLLVQTIRTSLRAAFVNYDSAREYLVYAHAAPGPKLAMEIVEDLSLRTTGAYDLPVAYDNDAAYPLWWYLRNYPHAFGFGAEPNRTVREYPVVFASDTNAPRYEAYLDDAYRSLTFERLWWPREDYTTLTWSTFRETLTNREMIRAIWQIWLNRDYDLYAQLTGVDVSTRGWQPASRMKMYIREDYAEGVPGLVDSLGFETDWSWSDSYADLLVDLPPETTLGGTGSTPGFFSAPRGLAIDRQGMLYIADSNNHRIQVFDPSGELQHLWGFFADSSSGDPTPGGLNQPWDLTIASDGSVIVVDTWNHRIQRFSQEGELLGLYDTSSSVLDTSGLYGPRAAAVDQSDQVYIVDTGNKRVLVYSLEGTLLDTFGSGGIGLGNLDEPVGIAVDDQGQVWVADTWNQRVQRFVLGATNRYEAQAAWSVDSWFGQSIENKPFLAINHQGDICVSDPEGGRILCFNHQGEFLLGFTGGGMILPSGLAFDEDCHLWVSDAGSDRVLEFDPGLCR
jgi:predicted membrane-bound mannosyltransferase/sugar lactone lactonase YvrE